MKKPVIIDLIFVVIALSFFLLRMYLFKYSWSFANILLLALVTAISSQLIIYLFFRGQVEFERYVKGLLGVSIVIYIAILVVAFCLAIYTLHFYEVGAISMMLISILTRQK